VFFRAVFFPLITIGVKRQAESAACSEAATKRHWVAEKQPKTGVCGKKLFRKLFSNYFFYSNSLSDKR